MEKREELEGAQLEQSAKDPTEGWSWQTPETSSADLWCNLGSQEISHFSC